MSEAKIETLQQAIEALYYCKATFKEKTHITEAFEGDTVWKGDVYIFDLVGQPDSQIAYGWSSPIEKSENKRIYAILHVPPIESAKDAVRASIASDYGSGKNGADG